MTDIAVKVFPGKPDQKNGPFIITTGDVMQRSAVFGPLIDITEKEQELYLGTDFTTEDLGLIFEFYKRCHAAGKTENPPAPELYNPRDPESVAKFEVPKDALAVFSSLRTKSFDGEDVLYLDKCVQLSNVADFLKMDHAMEGLAQILAEAIKDKAPEDIQVMRGKERKWTEEMEKEVIAAHPWLA